MLITVLTQGHGTSHANVGNSEHCDIPKLCLTEPKAVDHARTETPGGRGCVSSPNRKFPNKLLPLSFMGLARYDLHRPLNCMFS